MFTVDQLTYDFFRYLEQDHTASGSIRVKQQRYNNVISEAIHFALTQHLFTAILTKDNPWIFSYVFTQLNLLIAGIPQTLIGLGARLAILGILVQRTK